MNLEELSFALNEMIENAERGNVSVQYHLFGIKYANEISTSNIRVEDIVKHLGIKKSLASEIRKEIKLSEFVELKKF